MSKNRNGTKAKNGTSRKPSKKKGPSAEALRNFVRTRADEFLKDRNVTSVGVGLLDGEVCIQFTVAKKAQPEELEALGTKELPKKVEIDGFEVKTDVLERSFASSYTLVSPVETVKDPRKLRADPMVPGVSVSHPKGTAGTLGTIVYDKRTGAPCVLSNWHVLHTPEGKIGDPMVQPGPFDDNRVESNEAGTLIRSHLGPAGDCALAKIEGRSFDASVFDLDIRVGRIGTPELGDLVIKSGRTTGVTHGQVKRVDVMTKIDYGMPTGQCNIGGFEIGPLQGAAKDYEVSVGGDSGSVWLGAKRKNGKIVPTNVMLGLHFAGETAGERDEHALACYASSVFNKLEIALTPPPADEAGPQAVGGLGYDRDFVGKRVAVPTLPASKANDVVKLGSKALVPYTHFSVCLSASRKFAHFVAWNIDGEQLKAYGRKGLTFKKDPRLDADHQIGDELYSDNKLDRGHIARRADLVWGPKADAQRANKDSFFFTNITPQHLAFNQSERGGLWGELENAIFEDVDVERTRLSLLGGPIFKDHNFKYRGVRIPRSFWKLIAWIDGNSKDLQVKAYVLSQNDLLNDIEAFELDPFRLYQVGVEELAGLVRLHFSSAIVNADTFAHPEGVAPEDLPKRRVREVISRRDLP
jgi:endonuclease G